MTTEQEPFPASPEPQPHTSANLRAVLAAVVAYLALLEIATHLRTDGITAVIVSTLVSVGLLIWLSSALGRLFASRRAVVINLTVSTILVVPTRLMLAFHMLPLPWALLRHAPDLLELLAVASDLLLIWFACSVGGALARLLRGANLIPPVAAVLALVDIWTVMLGGPVNQMMQSAAPVARAATRALTVALPAPRHGAMPMGGAIGFADFVFIAFFIAAMCRFVPAQATYRRSVIALVAVLCPYMLLVMFSNFIPFLASLPGLPALLPMAVVMIAVHWRHFHYQRSEVFALIYAACFIAAIVGAFLFFTRRSTQRQDSVRPGGVERTAGGDRRRGVEGMASS